MKEKLLSIEAMISMMDGCDHHNYQGLVDIMQAKRAEFNRLFTHVPPTLEVYLLAPDPTTRDDLYNELRINSTYRKKMTVYLDQDCGIRITSSLIFYDLLKDPDGLLQLSRSMKTRFSLSYSQAYTNSEFHAEVSEGKLHFHKLVVKINPLLAPLSLGRLDEIVRNDAQFSFLDGMFSYCEVEQVL